MVTCSPPFVMDAIFSLRSKNKSQKLLRLDWKNTEVNENEILSNHMVNNKVLVICVFKPASVRKYMFYSLE